MRVEIGRKWHFPLILNDKDSNPSFEPRGSVLIFISQWSLDYVPFIPPITTKCVNIHFLLKMFFFSPLSWCFANFEMKDYLDNDCQSVGSNGKFNYIALFFTSSFYWFLNKLCYVMKGQYYVYEVLFVFLNMKSYVLNFWCTVRSIFSWFFH